MSTLLLAVLGCLGGAGPPSAERTEARPDIVLLLPREAREDPGEEVAVDALLAPLGPGLRFRAAYVQSVHPATSFGSMMTGLYPSAIPLCSRPQLREGEPMPWCVELPQAQRTLAEVLGVYGYRSLLVHEHIDLDDLARGFDEVIPLRLESWEEPESGWRKAAEAAREWWEAHADGPRLLVVETSLVHGEIGVDFRSVHREWAPDAEGRKRFIEAHPELEGRIAADAPWPFVDDEHLDRIRGHWVEACASAGRGMATLLEMLPSDDRLVAVAALHGISLGERTGTDTPEQARPGGHLLLTDRTTRVVLWLGGAGVEPGAVDAPVEMRDLLPTLAAAAGARAPAAVSGVDLLHGDPPGLAYAEWGDMLALREGRWWLTYRSQIHGITSLDPRLTENLLHPARAPQRVDFHLYDLAADPYQARDLAREEPERVWGLWEKMVAIRRGPGAPPGGILTWDRIEELRRVGALHYW